MIDMSVNPRRKIAIRKSSVDLRYDIGMSKGSGEVGNDMGMSQCYIEFRMRKTSVDNVRSNLCYIEFRMRKTSVDNVRYVAPLELLSKCSR